MKGKEIAVLFFVIAVLAFYIFSQKGEKTHYKLPELPKLEDANITSLKISRKDGVITLLREQDRWLVGVQKYPADESRAKGMVRKIASLSLADLIAESGNYALYELDDDNAIDVSVLKGDKVLRRVFIGKTASSYRHTFVKIDDDPRVYSSEGNLKNEFNRTIADLRDKKVLAFSEDITELTLFKGGKEMRLIKADSSSSEEPAKKPVDSAEKKGAQPRWTVSDGRSVKSDEVDKIVNTLTSFMCDGFINDKKKEDFTSPSYSLKLKGINEYTISFFEKQGGKYQAVSSYSEYPFLVSEWKAKQVMKEFGDMLAEESAGRKGEKKGP